MGPDCAKDLVEERNNTALSLPWGYQAQGRKHTSMPIFKCRSRDLAPRKVRCKAVATAKKLENSYQAELPCHTRNRTTMLTPPFWGSLAGFYVHCNRLWTSKLLFCGFGVSFFFTFYFILECGWLTMLWQFQVDSKGIQPYLYMYLFSPKLPSRPGCHKHWADFPMLYSRTLLVIHFKYSSVYMSIPNSLTNPSPTSPPDNHKFMNKQTLNPGATDWTFVSPRFICWILMLDAMVLGGRALGTCSVCEGRALMNRISALWNRLQDSMVLAQRQKSRSMEQNKKPRDKSMHLWTPYLWQRRQKYTIEKRQSL